MNSQINQTAKALFFDKYELRLSKFQSSNFLIKFVSHYKVINSNCKYSGALSTWLIEEMLTVIKHFLINSPSIFSDNMCKSKFAWTILGCSCKPFEGSVISLVAIYLQNFCLRLFLEWRRKLYSFKIDTSLLQIKYTILPRRTLKKWTFFSCLVLIFVLCYRSTCLELVFLITVCIKTVLKNYA